MSVIQNFESWGWDIMWFLNVRVTLLFAAFLKVVKQEKQEEVWASSAPSIILKLWWKRESETDLSVWPTWSVFWMFHVYTAAEKEVSDLIRQFKSDLRHCHPQKNKYSGDKTAPPKKTTRKKHVQLHMYSTLMSDTTMAENSLVGPHSLPCRSNPV